MEKQASTLAPSPDRVEAQGTAISWAAEQFEDNAQVQAAAAELREGIERYVEDPTPQNRETIRELQEGFVMAMEEVLSEETNLRTGLLDDAVITEYQVVSDLDGLF